MAVVKGLERRSHPRISSFFKDRIPDIELASELEKELRIQALVESPSFAGAHEAITRLAGYADFTEQQARVLLEGALANSQIRSISMDADVRAFFKQLIETHREIFDTEQLQQFDYHFRDKE
jgi:hypothetical protein